MKNEYVWTVVLVLVALAVWELFLRGFVTGLFTKKA